MRFDKLLFNKSFLYHIFVEPLPEYWFKHDFGKVQNLGQFEQMWGKHYQTWAFSINKNLAQYEVEES